MKRWRVALLLTSCFAFRLAFGLSRDFFFEDETQIFLLGFRYYATGACRSSVPTWSGRAARFPARCRLCWSACR
jgi:hypothetical protein